MSYETLRAYLRLLKGKSDPMDVRIDWAVIDPESVSAVEHRQLAALQIADAVASSFFYAVNVNRYGETEDKYARMLLSTCYRHKDSIHGYGLKYGPEEFEKLKLANPQLAMFAEGVKS